MYPLVVLPARVLNCDILERFSTYSELKRVTEYILRFHFNSSTRGDPRATLCTGGLARAEQYIAPVIQQQYYKSELGNLAPLNLFLDRKYCGSAFKRQFDV